MNDSLLKKQPKEVQRASYRFEKNTFEEFRELCKKNGFSQTKVLEKLMKDFVNETKEGKSNDK